MARRKRRPEGRRFRFNHPYSGAFEISLKTARWHQISALDVERRIEGACKVGAHRTSMLRNLKRNRPLKIAPWREMVRVTPPTCGK